MLRVHDLAIARGGLPVLEGLSFAVAGGEAVILRGPNGVGKTTLLRTIAGLQPPFAGRVEMAPETLAYAGHADGVKPTLTVTENLAFWAAMFGTARVDAALEAFDLTALADRAAMHLSAGQKRRLGLARIPITGRPLWLFDEPTVSLDTASTARFAAVVQAHCAGGGAAIVATHIDLGIAGRALDLAPFRAALPGPEATGGFDEAFT